ncbi:hypothetical protein K435DRAFT_793498 [Dendrothele bispora CBS 962.96]|uniref:Uncharacterized protein n=1 Tax=Dendrothele bispora (strain CBS 962.96) TaxID=1314807 RepID=A0A4S8MFD2_DENBC|nr:hypothetical protein K435DRAFT_793498 [Dendrothele bispora CBS 962.96]
MNHNIRMFNDRVEEFSWYIEVGFKRKNYSGPYIGPADKEQEKTLYWLIWSLPTLVTAPSNFDSVVPLKKIVDEEPDIIVRRKYTMLVKDRESVEATQNYFNEREGENTKKNTCLINCHRGLGWRAGIIQSSLKKTDPTQQIQYFSHVDRPGSERVHTYSTLAAKVMPAKKKMSPEVVFFKYSKLLALKSMSSI